MPKKKNKKSSHKKQSDSTIKNLLNNKILWSICILIIIGLVLMIIYNQISKGKEKEFNARYHFADGQAGILIIGFPDKDNQSSSKGDAIAMELKEELEKIINIKFKKLYNQSSIKVLSLKDLKSYGTFIVGLTTNINEPQKAFKLGKRLNASLVIWGDESMLTVEEVNVTICSYPILSSRREQIGLPEPPILAGVYPISSQIPRKFLEEFCIGLSFLTLPDSDFQISLALFGHIIKKLPKDDQLRQIINYWYALTLAASHRWYDIDKIIVKTMETAEKQNDTELIASLWKLKGDVYLLSNNKLPVSYKKALECYNKTLKLKPDDAGTLYNRAFVYTHEREFAKAEADIKQAHKLDKNNSLLYIIEALSLLMQNDAKSAIESINKGLKLNPEEAELYTFKGIALTAAKSFDEAIIAYTKALELNPKNLIAIHRRGRLYEFTEQYDNAINDYTNALKIDPDFDLLYYRRATLLINLNQWNEALVDMNKAIQCNPNFPDYYYYRASIWERKKKKELAKKDFAKFNELGGKLLLLEE